jgi:A/G-specific adenine glycosylase
VNRNEFQEIIWQKGNELYREMPWRTNVDPYYVLVSELMLQQTQVDRVIPKFEAFMQAFPSIQDLSNASLAEVLTLWSGLGYNRRAKFLHSAAQKVVNDFNGVLPDSLESLVQLPGVGPNTAGAILAYSFNTPVEFIETNVRTVYFYHFFEDQLSVTDK